MRALIFFIFALAAAAPTLAQEDEPWPASWGIATHGFFDARAGYRLSNDPYQDDLSLGEARMQLDLSRWGNFVTWQVRADFLYDEPAEETSLDLEEGTGWLDLREANALFSPTRAMDVKAGRQILTWGTGDLLFINDLFPKDWRAFFIGRDEEYLKAPSDAVFLSFFPSFANIDVAYTPRFDADRYIRGERISFWNPALGRRSGQDAVISPERPDDWLDDDEIALRIYKNVRGYEWAFYAYDGFWKSPAGFNAATGAPRFPLLRTFGASVRGPAAKGLLNLELGYYDSREDRDGADPFLPNSELRLLVGFERELARNLTGAFQYYLEWLQDYGAYETSLPDPARARDEARHVLTVRLTKLAMSQNLTLSFFAYGSPSDEDYYARPYVKYKLTDAWLLTAGANLFGGSQDHTFFGQFEKNANAYLGARFSF